MVGALGSGLSFTFVVLGLHSWRRREGQVVCKVGMKPGIMVSHWIMVSHRRERNSSRILTECLPRGQTIC